MKIATVLPARYSHLVAKDSYKMCLAHMMSDPEYSRHYTRQPASALFSPSYTIMDNGVVETGRPMESDRLVELVTLHRPDEIIAPDAIGDSDETLDLTEGFLKVCSAEGLIPYVSVMGVPHGSTRSEWMECARIMVEDLNIRALGVSKFSPSYRPRLVRELLTQSWSGWVSHIGNSINVHLLGAREHMGVWREFLYRGAIRGIDSGSPYFWTVANRGYPGSDEARPEVDGDPLLSPPDDLNEALLLHNLRKWRASLDRENEDA